MQAIDSPHLVFNSHFHFINTPGFSTLAADNFFFLFPGRHCGVMRNELKDRKLASGWEGWNSVGSRGIQTRVLVPALSLTSQVNSGKLQNAMSLRVFIGEMDLISSPLALASHISCK